MLSTVAGNRYTELLQSLKLVSRSAVANKRSYAGSPFEQSSRDASAELTGSSRHDDGRVIHDSDTRERTASMQNGRRPSGVDRRLFRSMRSTDDWHSLQRRRNKAAAEKKCVRVYSSEK